MTESVGPSISRLALDDYGSNKVPTDSGEESSEEEEEKEEQEEGMVEESATGSASEKAGPSSPNRAPVPERMEDTPAQQVAAEEPAVKAKDSAAKKTAQALAARAAAAKVPLKRPVGAPVNKGKAPAVHQAKPKATGALKAKRPMLARADEAGPSGAATSSAGVAKDLLTQLLLEKKNDVAWMAKFFSGMDKGCSAAPLSKKGRGSQNGREKGKREYSALEKAAYGSKPRAEYLVQGRADACGIRVVSDYFPNKQWADANQAAWKDGHKCFACGGDHRIHACRSRNHPP